MSSSTKTKICFFIAPIGAEGTDIRLRSDQVLKHIVIPAARECGYDAMRADQISEPGLITSQVIQHIVEDPLVIADLTGWNPNVFYELALRHALKKPVVQIISATESIPFDVAASRTVHVDHRDLDSVARAKEEIVRQIKSVEKNPADVDTPISVAVELQALRRSDNPLDKSYADIITLLTEIRSRLFDIGDVPKRPWLNPAVIEDVVIGLDRIVRAVDPEEGKPMSPEQVDLFRSGLFRTRRAADFLCMEAGVPPDAVLRGGARKKE